MMLSTASQQPSVCKLHVHVENAVSASQILEACRNLGDGRGEEHGLIQYLLDLNLMTAAATTGEWTPCATCDTWESVLRKEGQGFQASQESPVLSSVIFHAAEALTLLNQYRKTSLFQDPTSLMESFSSEEGPLSQSPSSSDGTEYEIVASIWWILQRLQATSVTFTPITCTAGAARCLSELLQGIPVQLVTGEASDTAPTADGIAICRSLVRTTASATSSPPPLLLQHVGTSQTTTVIVGMRTAVAAAVPDPQQTCSNDSGCLETTTEADTSLDSRQGASSTTTELSQLERPYWNVHRDLSLLEANIDDMTGEQLAFACDQLLTDPDCLDVWLTPIVMKKGRPAHTLHCLVRNSQMQPIIVELFHLTTTLGVRVQNQQSGLCRVALRRVLMEVTVHQTAVRVKVGYIGPQVCSVKPEFEDCKQIALTSSLSLDQVAFEATAKARITLNQQKQQEQQRQQIQQGEVLEVL